MHVAHPRRWPLILLFAGCLSRAPTPTPAPQPYAPPVVPSEPLSITARMERCRAAPRGEVFAEPIVDAAASAKVNEVLRRQHVSGRDLDFNRVVELFYAEHADIYDFLFLYAPDDGGSTWGLHEFVAPRDARTIGVVSGGRPELSAQFPHLRSVILMKLPADDVGGPTLHELAHYWGSGLGAWPALGFPQAPHWGTTGVGGQLGGFQTRQLACLEPRDAVPPACTPEEDGRYKVLIPPFGEVANGGDTVYYAPLELYLMGLLPAEQVPPIAIPEDARRLNAPSGIAHGLYSVSGVRWFEVEQLSALSGGPPPPRIDADHELRVAFAYVTPEPDPAGLARVARQARQLSGVQLSGVQLSGAQLSGVEQTNAYSWCVATGARSTVRADLD